MAFIRYLNTIYFSEGLSSCWRLGSIKSLRELRHFPVAHVAWSSFSSLGIGDVWNHGGSWRCSGIALTVKIAVTYCARFHITLVYSCAYLGCLRLDLPPVNVSSNSSTQRLGNLGGWHQVWGSTWPCLCCWPNFESYPLVNVYNWFMNHRNTKGKP